MPRKTIEVTTNLHGVGRLNNSVNGNPRFTLHTTDGDFTTQTDASCNYDVENVWGAIGRDGNGRVTLKMTPARRVWSIERA